MSVRSDEARVRALRGARLDKDELITGQEKLQNA
jgi:hypothetical protein